MRFSPCCCHAFSYGCQHSFVCVHAVNEFGLVGGFVCDQQNPNRVQTQATGERKYRESALSLHEGLS